MVGLVPRVPDRRPGDKPCPSSRAALGLGRIRGGAAKADEPADGTADPGQRCEQDGQQGATHEAAKTLLAAHEEGPVLGMDAGRHAGRVQRR